jgi:exodeoxyribonuclease VII small subunit
LKQLERGDISLEDSITMYEEGILLSRECLEKLNQADLKLKILEKDMKGNFRLNEEEQEE